MKKDLKSKLIKYSALASAAATVSVANGQVKYTDINDTTVSTNGGFYDLDLNQDGNPDFRLTQFVDSGITQNVNAVLISPFDSVFNRVIGESINGFNYPANVTPGTVINQYENFQGIGGSEVKGYMAFTVDDTISYPNSNWVGPTTNGFLGMQVRIGDSLHFAWARIDVSMGSNSFTVKDFAVELTPGDSIISAGNLLGIAQNVFDNSAIISNNKTLKIVLNKDLTDVELVLLDLQGRFLREEDLTNGTSVFDLSELADGVYLVHLKHKGVIRTEKIIIQ
jgi:hypothetical protein